MNYCSECGTKLNGDEIYCSKCNFEIKKDIKDLAINKENDFKEQKKSEEMGVVSLILALIPYSLFLYCLITSGGSFSEAGDGAVWWLFVMYIPFGIPISIVSYVLAVKSSENKKNRLATISCILYYIPLILVAIFAIVLAVGVLSDL